MGLNELIASLIRSAQDEAERRRARAREEAERIVAEARARVAGRVATAVAEREACRRGELRRELARERRARRSALLERRDRQLASVLELTRARLPEVLRRPQYRTSLTRDLTEAATYLGDEGAVVRAPPVLREPIEEWLARRADWSLELDPTRTTGPVITSLDGRLTVDLSLETRLGARWERLSQQVARWLAESA